MSKADKPSFTYPNPIYVLILMTVSVFVIELSIMYLLPGLDIFSHTLEEIVDASLLTIVLFPILYFFLFRPLLVQVEERKRVEKALQEALGESQQRQAEISALLDSPHLEENHEFVDVAKLIFNICKNLIGASSGYVALSNSEGMENEIVFLDPGGLPCNVDPNLPMPIRGLRDQVYREQKAVRENDFPIVNGCSLCRKDMWGLITFYLPR